MSVVNLDDRRPKQTQTYYLTFIREDNTLTLNVEGTDMSGPSMLEVARDLASAAEALYDFHKDD